MNHGNFEMETNPMEMQHASLRTFLLATSTLLALGTAAFAADVTPDRLANPEAWQLADEPPHL